MASKTKRTRGADRAHDQVLACAKTYRGMGDTNPSCRWREPAQQTGTSENGRPKSKAAHALRLHRQYVLTSVTSLASDCRKDMSCLPMWPGSMTRFFPVRGSLITTMGPSRMASTSSFPWMDECEAHAPNNVERFEKIKKRGHARGGWFTYYKQAPVLSGRQKKKKRNQTKQNPEGRNRAILAFLSKLARTTLSHRF